MYIYIHVYVCVCMYVCICTYRLDHVRLGNIKLEYIVYMYINEHVYVYICICMYVYIYK